MSDVSCISSKRNRLDDVEYMEKVPSKRKSRHFKKWSVSVSKAVPIRRMAKHNIFWRSKSLGTDLLSSPLTPTSSSEATLLNANFAELCLESGRKELKNETFEKYDDECNAIFRSPELLMNIFQHLDNDSLYNCSKVSPLWRCLISSILNHDIVYQHNGSLNLFHITERDGKIHPKNLSFYKFRNHHDFAQKQLPILELTRLNSLKFYISPVIPQVFHKLGLTNTLRKLTIAGDKNITDKQLIEIVMGLPDLVELDLRACTLISDVAIVSIVKYCPLLENVNLGRHENANLITDLSVMALSQLQNLKTLGLSGCHMITDVSIWQLYSKRASTLHRISINGCTKITDNSITDIVSKNGFPKLSMLDIRNCSLIRFKQLMDYRNWKFYKFQKTLHIHVCDGMKAEFQAQEQELNQYYRHRILNDLNKWINE